MDNNETHSAPPRDAIVVFAKAPIPGQAKTRLIPLLGEDGSADLARAMLSDVLVSLSSLEWQKSTYKILMYAPGDSVGQFQMTRILEGLGIQDQWLLEPMISGELGASDLGAKLTHALRHTRQYLKQEGQFDAPVTFLGMDSPELPLDELEAALSYPKVATMCPAQDGGYGLLRIPSFARDTLFEGIRWSDSLTAVSQLKGLTDAGVPVRLGRLMNDIDEPTDVKALAARLERRQRSKDEDATLEKDVLLQNSSGRRTLTSECPFTIKALQQLNMLKDTLE
jgi:glycosyltransferase A (GT-A) superfamily protein (DUF2064 family)